MKLYLGCGTRRLDGYVHVDIAPMEGVDVVWDLDRRPWPWDDGSATDVVAEDLVEHLSINLIEFCDEAWRILKPDGELFVRTPHHTSDNSWIDPTHRWHLDERSFHYLDPETYFGATKRHYTQRKWRIISLGARRIDNIRALLTPRK